MSLHREQAPGYCVTVLTNRCRDLILIRIPVTIYFADVVIKISVFVVTRAGLTKQMPAVHAIRSKDCNVRVSEKIPNIFL